MQNIALYLTLLVFSSLAEAKFSFEPYASISEKKSITSNISDGTQNTKIIMRKEAGFRSYLHFNDTIKLQLSVGQSNVENTQNETDIIDTYGEIDFSADADLSGQTSSIDTTIIETQNKAKFSLIIDPKYKEFIFRGYAGVTAMQRIVEIKQDGTTLDKVNPDPTYKPHMGFGIGYKVTNRTYAIAEYEFYLYSFPEFEPFERSVSVGYGVSL